MTFSTQMGTLHLGLTSKCTLKCPECVRTMTPLWRPHWRRLHEMKQIDWHNYTSLLNHLQFRQILFCGNWGDPIYYPQLIPFCKWIVQHIPQPVVIHTNGSYKTREFWQELGETLRPRDRIIFSIDGFIDNDQYRVNNDKRTRLIGLNTLLECNRRPQVIQKCIVFSYNQDDLEQIAVQSKQLGFDRIGFNPAWISDEEWLRPDDDREFPYYSEV